MQSGARPGQCGSPVAGACPRPSRRRRLALAHGAAPVFTERLSQSFLGRPSVPVGARVLFSVAAAACRPRSPCGQGEPRPRPLLRDLCVGREPSARDSWPDLAQGAPRSPRAARSVPAPCVPAIFRGGGVRASRPRAVLRPQAAPSSRGGDRAQRRSLRSWPGVRRPSAPFGVCDVLRAVSDTRRLLGRGHTPPPRPRALLVPRRPGCLSPARAVRP